MYLVPEEVTVIFWDEDDTARAVGIGLVILAFIGLALYANAQTYPPSRSAVLRLADPWGQVGADVNVQAVEIGGLQCAVLTQRIGSDRRVSLWCK